MPRIKKQKPLSAREKQLEEGKNELIRALERTERVLEERRKELSLVLHLGARITPAYRFNEDDGPATWPQIFAEIGKLQERAVRFDFLSELHGVREHVKNVEDNVRSLLGKNPRGDDEVDPMGGVPVRLGR